MTQYAPPQPTIDKPSNGLGLTGFVLGLVGLLFSFIPFIGVIAWPLVVLGIIFSAIGISKASKGRATNKGLAVAGLVVSVVGLAVCVVWAVVFKDAVDEVREEAAREEVIVYELTGDATNVDVSYQTFDDGASTNDETVATLPWSKEVRTTGIVKGGHMIVTTGETGGTVTCRITVDGKEVSTETATGPFEMITCDSL